MSAPVTSIIAIAASFTQLHLVGTGTTFLLPAQPLSNSMLLFLNGLFLTNGVDYTLNNATVTLIKKQLTTVDVLTAFYMS